jgi:hypothetical protein
MQPRSISRDSLRPKLKLEILYSRKRPSRILDGSPVPWNRNDMAPGLEASRMSQMARMPLGQD